MKMEWPLEEAKRTKLYCKDSRGVTVKATFNYKAELNQIQVVQVEENLIITDSNNNEQIAELEHSLVLDVVSLDDVIGVDLEVKLPLDDVAPNIVSATDDVQASTTKEESNVDSQSGDATGLNQSLLSNYASCNPTKGKGSAIFNIYCYPRAKPSRGIFSQIKECAFGKDDSATTIGESNFGHRYEHHRHYEVQSCEDFADVRKIVRAIRFFANLTQNYPGLQEGHQDESKDVKSFQPRQYLVILNPYSGTKEGQKVYDTHVKSMLDQSGVEHELLTTKHAGHAGERMKCIDSTDEDHNAEKDVSEYDAIIVMGGDGILHEVLQGLRKRSDFKQIMKRIKFGIVGCGTSNGLAASILHAAKERYSPLESTFLICKGNSAPLDLSTYETVSSKRYTSFLTFSWAFISDVDIESECVRFLGRLRNDVFAFYRMLNLRTYRARFSYLLEDGSAAKTAITALPPLSQSISSENWNTVEDDFILFWVSHVTHASSSTIQSPDSTFADGMFRIFVIRQPISRFTLTRILLSIETGTHTSYDKVEFFNCKAFRLEPITEGSFNDLDGEVIESGPLQAYVNPSAMSFFIK